MNHLASTDVQVTTSRYILQVSPALDLRAGGVGPVVLSLVRELAKAGEVVTLACSVDPSSSGDVRIDGLCLLECKPSYRNWKLALRVLKTCWLNPPRLVHLHGLWEATSVAVLIISILKRIPIVVSPHGMLDEWALGQRRLAKWLALLLVDGVVIRRSKFVHAVSGAECDTVVKLFPGTAVCIARNGLGGQFKDLPMPNHSIRFRRQCFLYFGRLHKKKGIELFLRAFAMVKSEGGRRNDWSVMIAGPDTDGERNRLEALVLELGLVSSVNFIGPIIPSARAEVFSRVRWSFLTSYSEGLPMAVLESWGFYVPTIISSACNLGRFATECGCPVVESTIESISEGVRVAMDMDDDEYSALGVRCREVVTRKFSATKQAAIIQREYGTANTPG